jgi:c-di-GMP-binding flagellar brake protein YcgR
MPEIGPEKLIARDPCTLKTGLLGKRGKLSLYADRVVFTTSAGVKGHELTLDRLEWIELRGRGRKILAIGFEGGESAFKMDSATSRFGDLCALLVQLFPTPPWLDPRFGKADPDAVATFLEDFGEALHKDERLLLCEWALSWSGDTHIRCGWLALTSRRILFLPTASGPERAQVRTYRPKLVARVADENLSDGQLAFVADSDFLRFDPYGGSAFVREFWTFCDAPIHNNKEQVRGGQSLRRLEGTATLVRFLRTQGQDLLLEDLHLEARKDRLLIRTRYEEHPALEHDETCVVEVIKRAGLFRFEAAIGHTESIDDGPFKPSFALTELLPTSDIRFVNRRRAFRVEVNIPIHVKVEGPSEDGGWEPPVSTLFRMADISNVGCALVGPRDIDPASRLTFDLPLESDDEVMTVQAECVHILNTPGTELTRQYGCHLLGLSQRKRDRIQQEVVRHERLQLQRRSRIKR